jgi:hypothetical protein
MKMNRPVKVWLSMTVKSNAWLTSMPWGSEEEGRVTLAVSGTAWALTQDGPTTLRHH